MSRLNLREWTYDGVRMDHPALVLFRILLIVPIYALMGPLWVLILLGWGKHTANKFWSRR